MRRELLLSVIDQALLSAFNLGLSLLLIALATPAEFGHFVVLFSAGFVLLSIQNALIVMPLNYLLPGREPPEQQKQLGMLTGINLVLAAAAAAAGALLCLFYPGSPLLLSAVAGYFCSNLLREYSRNVFVVRGQMSRALLLDGLFVGTCSAAGLGLWQVTDPVTASMLALCAGNAVSAVLVRADLAWKSANFRSCVANYRDVWLETRWALLGAAQTEAQSRGYVFIVEAWRGAASLGTIQAGRVVLQPLALVATAWSRVARPAMAALFARGAPERAFPILWQGMLIVSGLAVAYGLALGLSFPLLQDFVFRGKYADMEQLVLLWWVYTTLLSLNGVVGTLLQARRQFRELALLGMCTAALCLASLGVLAQTALPAIAALGVLILAELFELGGQLWLTFRRSTALSQPVPAE